MHLKLPSKLTPKTERDIFEKVAEKLGLTEEEVEQVYEAWIIRAREFSNHPNPSFRLVPIGKLYLTRFKNVTASPDLAKKHRIKFQYAEERIPERVHNAHYFTRPLHCSLGTDLPNLDLGKNYKGEYEPYTIAEIARQQNNRFFKHDKEWRHRQDIFKYFFDEEPQELLFGEDVKQVLLSLRKEKLKNVYKNIHNNKSKTKKQRTT